ncbi:MAG: hypothetical protein GC191_13030 [Azospirillum sp.]|nr:hypothetical protein [Azospirillum sp.]
MDLQETFRSACDRGADACPADQLDLRGEPSVSELSGTITLHDVDNARSRLRRGAEDQIVQGQIAGTVSGLILSGPAAAIRAAELAKAAAERKADEDRELQFILDQIEQLQRDIAALERRIADIEDRAFTAEEKARFDTLPEHERQAAKDAAIRRKVQEGKITAAEYEEWLRLQAEVAAKKNELEEKNRELQRIHGRTYDAVQARAEATGNPEAMADRAGRESLMLDTEVAAVDGMTRANAAAAERVTASELRLLKLELKAQVSAGPSAETTARIDGLIASLDQNTLDAIAFADEINPLVQTRVGVLQIKRQVAALDVLKGTGEYAETVGMIISEAPEHVREALRAEPGIDPELANALYQPFSETLDREIPSNADATAAIGPVLSAPVGNPVTKPTNGYKR